MNHVFLCGFNRFQQIQVIQNWLQSVADKYDERTASKQTLTAGEIEVGAAGEELERYLVSEHAVFTLLKKVGTLNDNIHIQHAEMTWSRIGITVSTGTPTGDNTAQKCLHTAVCGYRNQRKLQTSEELELRIADCALRASKKTDFLLQRNDRFLLLEEDRDQAEELRVTTSCDEGSSESGCGHTFGAVSGTDADFVSSYDGISVGTLSKGERYTESPETGERNQEGVHLILTCLDSGLSVQLISCGLEHSVFLTCHGSVLTCGSGSRGQLGHGSLEDEKPPRVVSAFEGVRCTYVAAGGWHSAAVTECGDLFMWGWNESGQLGLPSPGLNTPRSLTSPQQQKQQQQLQPRQQCQQSHQHQQDQQSHQEANHEQNQEPQWQQHPQHLQEHQPLLQSSQQQQCHQQQQGFHQQIESSHPSHQLHQHPHQIQHSLHHQRHQQQQQQQQQTIHQHQQESQQQSEFSQPWHQQAQQYPHQYHLHDQHQQQHQRDCHPSSSCRAASLHLWPQMVEVAGGDRGSQEDVVVSKVACGSRHTAILTESGEALTAGWNKYGQLGLPHTNSVDQFMPVSFGEKYGMVTQLWCGSWNTMFVVKELSGME